MKRSLRTKLSSTIALVVIITIALTSFLANYFINEKFNDYVTRKQEQRAKEIVSMLSTQHIKSTNTWNMDYIYSIGMYSLYDGYIIKVYDENNKIIWDAQAHDMTLCAQIMDDISDRMEARYPQIKGEFKSDTYHITINHEIYGAVSISYFGPFFLSENDFLFLGTLNTIFIGIGIFSLVFSVIVGIMLAKRLSNPILKTVNATKQISEGNYYVRIEEKTTTEEVDMLIVSINHLASSLENQENLRKQLTEDVAHELRTPIAVLQAHLEALVDGVWKPSTSRLQSCYDEVTRIGKLVSDLENLARVDRDNLTLNRTKINLMDVIKMAINTFETEIRNKSLNVRLSGQCGDILVDQDRISQVVMNLLSNAIKYTLDDTNIDIILTESKNAVKFSIKDYGVGIPENELPFIFERFYRADKSRNSMTGGSGIGLAIVKSIVEAHGGNVKVESQVDIGSRFEVTLPKK
jgi:signal transduction histidine kinase